LRSYIGKKKYSGDLSLGKVIKSIMGLGPSHLSYLLRRMSISEKTLLKRIGFSKIESISQLVLKHSVLSDLRKYRRKILLFQRKIGTYRGIRMRQGLPRNGQRTRSNAGTPRRHASKYLF